MNIQGWLLGLGLEQYATAFRENEIGDEVLPKLTAEDLKELGVAIVGHRRKILAAIEELRDSSRISAKSTKPVSVANSDASLAAPASGERRQLTIMFCDLVGSTAFAARLDPEDMGELVRAFHSSIAAAVKPFDGHVAQLMGDGALIFFGYPRAHEDDAERAARAGIAIVDAVAALRRERGVALEVRIGIATGLVVVGELDGEGVAHEPAVVGETPNLAARLQALAEPGSIVIAEATQRLLGRTFELKALGPQVLKGFDAPVPAWVVVREADDVSRFEAFRRETMTPFVGREQEIALLVARWRDAAEGEGQVVLLSGEAGIGKSRILATLRERIGEQQVTLRYQCSPHHANDAFYPIIGQIRHAAGFVDSEPPAMRLDRLEAMIGRSVRDVEAIAPYLASLLSIPTDGRYPPLKISSSELRDRTVGSVITLFEGQTQAEPVLALLEDAHWLDPSSLELFSRLVERLQSLRALMIVTFRSEFAPPWLGSPHVTPLGLNRFGRRQALAMIDRVAGGKVLPTEVLDEIVAKTDGVPLFLEELTKTVLESGLLREENGSYVPTSALTPLAIPLTLRDALMARLDRLAAVKEVAQIGAVIGREFSWRLLEAVSPITGQELREALDQLIQAQLIHVRGVPPETLYVFKHALVQDTAYASLLRTRRQGIHADIARALTERFANGSESSAAVVARHFTEAGLFEPAGRHWLIAAELSLSTSAHAEAVRQADAGLAVVGRFNDVQERQSLELALHLTRAKALMPLKGYSAPETVAALTAAKRLLDGGTGSDLQLFSVLDGLCAADMVASRMESSLAIARQMTEAADRQDDWTYRLIAHRQLGAVQVFLGQHREALESLRRAERYRDPVRQKPLSYQFGVDPGIDLLSWKVVVMSHLGLLDQAARARGQVRAELMGHGHAQTVAACNTHSVVWPALMLRDFKACERHGAELLAYCAERRIEPYRIFAAIFHACARAIVNPTAENVTAIRATLDANHYSGGSAHEALFLAQLAEASLLAGDVASAETALQEGFTYVERSKAQHWLAELHRLDGLIALKRPDPDGARASACFLKAIEIASGQEARILELRAANDLVRLKRAAGSIDDSQALLTPILAAIEGGENMPDVRNARALLVA